MRTGMGVTAVVEGKRISAGNEKLLKNKGAKVPEGVVGQAQRYISRGSTVTYVAVDDETAGYIVLSDTVRPESAETVKDITALGIEPVLLTGDHESSAREIAKAVGIDTVKAGCLPEDKLNFISEYQERGQARLHDWRRYQRRAGA